MWLLYVSCAWVAGIFLGSEISLPSPALLLALIPFTLILFVPSSRKTLVVAGLCLLALLGGGLRYSSGVALADEHSLCFYNDSGVVQIKGMVAEEPDNRDRYGLLKFSAHEIVVDGEAREVSGTALVRVPLYPSYGYGDVLRVTGKLQTPPELEGFDYATYLEGQGICSVVYYPRLEVLDRGQGLKPLEWLYSLRERLAASLARALPEPQASLAQGVLLGRRHNIPDSLHEAFSRTGTAHLLAISGLHLSIVLAVLLTLGIGVFGRQRGTYIWIALAAIWFYVLLVGVRPPIVRAAIMGSLFLIATYLGRQGSAIIALAFAAAVMVGIQPHLLWSTSFRLSFLAMAGLVLLFPCFQAWGRRAVAAISKNRKAWATAGGMITDVFAASLAAIIAVWPIIAYNFGIVSLVSLPATFFSLPALPFIIMASASIAVAGLVAALAAQVLGWLAWLFLSYLIFVVEGFDALPHSSLEVAAISAWHVWVYYAALAGAVTCVNNRVRLADLLARLGSGTRKFARGISRRGLGASLKWLIPPLLIIAILLWSAVLTAPDERLHVSILDVGQGDAILVQTPGGYNVLIDGGPDPRKISLELGNKLPFWDRTIDLVVCTQPHGDHITGLVEVLQRYTVRQVIEPGVAYDSCVYREWLRLIEDKEIEYNLARAGQVIDLGQDITMEVLNPPPEFFQGTSCDIDNNGVVLKLTWNRVSFLFAADIREEAELELVMQRADLESTVLKAAHHGSMTSTIPQFLSQVDPEVAVISAGADNPFGHPSPEVLERLVDRLGGNNVYRTDRQGTIEFITDGERLWVKVGVLRP